MQRSMSARMRFLVTTVGFACLYTVAIVFFYYEWLLDIDSNISTLVYGFVLNGFLCLAALGVSFAVRKRLPVGLLPLIALGSYVGAFVCLLLPEWLGGETFVYCAGAFAGIGAGIAMPLWFEQASLLAGNRFAYILGFGSLASVGAIAIGSFNLVIMVAACGILILCSAIAFVIVLNAKCDKASDSPTMRYGQEAEQVSSGESFANNKAAAVGKGSDRPLWATLIAPLVYVFILSIIYGVLDAVAVVASSSVPLDSVFASQVGGFVIDVVFLLYVKFDGRRYALLLNAALGMIATGLIFLPFLPESYSIALVVLTHMGWEMALLVSYALVIELFRGRGLRLVGAAAIVFAFPRPGVMAGSAIASFVVVDNQYAFAQMTILAFALLYLIMMGAWLIRTREKRSAERAIRKRDDLIRRYAQARDELYVLACDELAQNYGLTKREAELVGLLAQGRDAAFIESELFLSRNTVKSYTKSVYVKLDVHSKQELIDLVKASLPIE